MGKGGGQVGLDLTILPIYFVIIITHCKETLYCITTVSNECDGMTEVLR